MPAGNEIASTFPVAALADPITVDSDATPFSTRAKSRADRGTRFQNSWMPAERTSTVHVSAVSPSLTVTCKAAGAGGELPKRKATVEPLCASNLLKLDRKVLLDVLHEDSMDTEFENSVGNLKRYNFSTLAQKLRQEHESYKLINVQIGSGRILPPNDPPLNRQRFEAHLAREAQRSEHRAAELADKKRALAAAARAP